MEELGNSYLAIDDKKNALKWYEKALTINSDSTNYLHCAAEINRKLGNLHEAINLYTKAINRDPKFIPAYIGASRCMVAQRDFDKAESLAKSALKIAQYSPSLNEILGIICQQSGRLNEAEQHYRQELLIDPNT